jgi:hypothetical protein
MRIRQNHLFGVRAFGRTLALPLAALFLLGASACDSSPTGVNDAEINVSITTDQPTYAPGSEIVISYTNRGSTEIGYNLCWSWLERNNSGAWVRLQDSPGHVCTAEIRTLAPGATATTVYPLPAVLAAGEYRVRTRIESFVSGGQLIVTTNTFQIRN